MKMTMSTASTLPPQRVHRKVLRAAAKRLNSNTQRNNAYSMGKGVRNAATAVNGGIIRLAAQQHHHINGAIDPCENSNDSGLGFDHHMDYPPPVNNSLRNKFPRQMATANNAGVDPQRDSYTSSWSNLSALSLQNQQNSKKCKMEIKMESDDSNDNYNFPENVNHCKETTSLIRTAPTSIIPSLGRTQNHNTQQQRAVPRCLPLTNRRTPTGPITLTTQLSNISRNGKVQLQIICQPEQQHRARYQTEGSRGAVKDRTGNGFPIVKLIGYDKPATLQVFIGTDIGRVAPHMFYQACRVSGKNSTPCVEKKIEGTIVIEVDLDPLKEMMVTCDCVGILKERNVDVEHRFPDQSGPRSKKKSTRCRMVFRTTITQDDGSTETLQTTSQPIVCTQPPGIPEICKKSLSICPATGNMELFILGKNFLKDTRVIFQQYKNDVATNDREILWEESVVPDKEYLQQTHLVCVVPPYFRNDILEPVSVSLFVFSSGKTSEAHQFMYTPTTSTPPPSSTSTSRVTSHTSHSSNTVPSLPASFLTPSSVSPSGLPTTTQEVRSVMIWQQLDQQSSLAPKSELDMMPPPISVMPIISAQRRLSTNLMTDSLKTEMMDDSSQSSEHYHNENSMDVHPSDSNMASSLSDNSMDGCSNAATTLIHNSLSILRHENSIDRSMVPPRLALPPDPNLEPQTPMVVENNVMPTLTNLITENELKGIDLRMKASEADLINTAGPTLATLRHFGVGEATQPLPAQSAQSVENYLCTIENNNKLAQSGNLFEVEGPMANAATPVPEVPVETTTSAATLTAETNHILAQTQHTTLVVAQSAARLDALVATAMETTINNNILTETAATVKLDALVNSTVDTHMGSPPSPTTTPSPERTSIPPVTSSNNILLNSQVLDNIIQENPTTQQSVLSPTHKVMPPTVAFKNILLNPNTDVFGNNPAPMEILNENTPLPRSPTVITHPIPFSPTLDTNNNTNGNVQILSPPVTQPNMFMQQFEPKMVSPIVPTSPVTATSPVIPIPVKEMQSTKPEVLPVSENSIPPTCNGIVGGVIKEQRLITQEITTMSDTDLLSYINPSCFDQGRRDKVIVLWRRQSLSASACQN